MTDRELTQRITEYLTGGGLFNPEMANHEAVRDLLIDCRDALAQPEQEPVAYWNGKDMFKRADEVQYVVNWTDYYHYPLYSEPVKERISEPLANLIAKAEGDEK